MPETNETVKTTILIDANKALSVIRQINDQMLTTKGASSQLQKAVSDYSRTLGQSFEKTLAQFKQLNAQFLSVPQKFTAEGMPIEESRKDITADVFREAEALNRASQAKNAYTTADTKATSANYNYDGSIRQVNKSLAEESLLQQRVAREMNILKTGGQVRTPQGTFGQKIPTFEAQFKSLSTYQDKLRLVQTTIDNIAKKTGAPIKDIGRELGKSFPTLLKDTNLVATAVDNLSKKNAGLSASFKAVSQSAMQVRMALTQLQAAGKLNITGNAARDLTTLKDAFKSIKSTTGAPFSAIAGEMKRMGIEGKLVSEALIGVNKEMLQGARGASGFRHGIDIIRTAMGTLVAVGIFQFMSLITESFQEATKAARELETSLFRLSNAERILSQSGADVSMEGLKKGIQEIKELFPIFSEEDITQLVAQVSIGTKELGLTEKQIINLSKAIAVLNIRSTEEETASQTAQKVITALSARGRGIGQLSVSFSEATLKAKALEMGIIKAGDSLEGMDDKTLGLIKTQVLLDNTNKELEDLGSYMETNDAIIRQNTASWHDLLTTVGSVFTALTPLLSPLLEGAETAANGFKLVLAIILSISDAMKSLGANIRFVFEEVFATINPVEKFKKMKEGLTLSLGEFSKDIESGLGERVKRLFPEVPAGMSQQFQDIIGYYLGAEKETETAAIDLQSALDSIDTSKAQEELEDLLKDLENLQEKMAEKEADFQLDVARFDEDALIERQRAIEDYNLNVLQATRAFNLQKKEANDKYRQKEIEDERKFQEQMRQLQENFLYNLEDALRERDARQVLRLIDKYQMEKQALINENALRKQAAAENQKIEDDQRKAQFEERLRVMAEEQAIRLQRMDEESALKRQRMEEDHAIEMQRLKEQLDERIQEAATKIAEEYNVNAEGAQKIYDLLQQYYGTDGALAQLTAQGYNSMLGQAQGFLTELTGIIGQYASIMSGAASMTFPNPAQQSLYNYYDKPGDYQGFAKGGQFVATRPKKITVGEGGEPELVTITPLSQLSGSPQNGIVGANGLNGANGQTQISVMVDLSPDLEARVVEKSLDGAAEVISQVRRSKV